MLNRYVTAAREVPSPWEGPRAARVLQRAIEARRRSSRSTMIPWIVALAGASVAAFAVRTASRDAGPMFEDQAGGDLPAVVGIPSDALDGGKQTG